MRALSRTERGFSLVELLITLAIGVAGLAVASYFAGAAIKSSSRGDQLNNLSSSSRLIGRQLRTDLRIAGYGSKGAIGVADTAFWNAIRVSLPSGFFAIPSVRGADNLSGGELDGALPGTDALALVVPDPSTLATSGDLLPQGAPPAGAPDCGSDFVLVADYSAANGAGRSQILVPGEQMAFNAGAGSGMLCARLSVYWLDETRALRRTDIASDGGPPVLIAGTSGSVPWQPSQARTVTEVITPGVIDLQFAYALSAEAGGLNTPGSRAIANPEDRWAFSAAEAYTIDDAGRPEDWFEVRQVRVSLYARSLRSMETSGGAAGGHQMTEETLENAPAYALADDFAASYGRVRVVTSETLSNLRFFDMNVPAGVPAEPY